MEFGGNATPYLDSDEGVEHYKNSISRQIAYVKKAYPQALLLLIGPADMSTMIAGERQTYPFLETTIEALQEAAMENDAMFWNMYDVMGGRNSMLKWVEHEPKWAATDYVHFTETGAKRIAEVFVQSFLNTYDYYHFLKRNKKWSGVE
jgi:lysophospholipase L1-like esterase